MNGHSESYREVLKDGYFVMTRYDASDGSENSATRSKRSLAHRSSLKTLLMWDQSHFGNVADVCPIIKLASRNGGACYDPMDGGCKNLLQPRGNWDILADARRRHGI